MPIPGDQETPWEQVVPAERLDTDDDRQLGELYTAVDQRLLDALASALALTKEGAATQEGLTAHATAESIADRLRWARTELAVAFHHFQATTDELHRVNGEKIDLETRETAALAPITERHVAIFNELHRQGLDPFRFEFTLDQHGNTLLTYKGVGSRYDDYAAEADYWYRHVKDLTGAGGAGLAFLGYGADSLNRRGILVTYR